MRESLLIVFCGLIAFIDWRTRRIPNWLTFSGMAIGTLLALLTEGWPGFLGALGGMGVGLLLFLGPYLAGGMGGGDVKALMAVGAMGGPAFVFTAFLFSALAGGAFSLVALLGSRKGRMHLGLWSGGRLMASGLKVPYGIPIALGTVVALYYGG